MIDVTSQASIDCKNIVDESKLPTKKYQCDLCKKVFKSSGSLRIHRHRGKKKGTLKFPHEKGKTICTTKVMNKIHQCEVCRKVFKNSSSLRTHKHREQKKAVNHLPSWRENWANGKPLSKYIKWREDWENITETGFGSFRSIRKHPIYDWEDLFAKRSAPYSIADVLQIKFRFFKCLYPFFGLEFEDILTKREKKFIYLMLDSTTKDCQQLLNNHLDLLNEILKKIYEFNAKSEASLQYMD